MREEEKETNTTPQKNQVSLSLLKSVLWCSFLVALFCRGCLVVVVHVLRSSLSLSLVSFIAAEKKWNKKRGSPIFFLFMFRVLVKKNRPLSLEILKVFRLTFEY